MNHNKKIIKVQRKISLNKLKSNNIDFIESYISADKYKSQFFNNIAQRVNPLWRNRIYTQEKSLSMFVSQSINQDGSCQNVVNKLALDRDKKTSISTSGYCKARNRLSVSTIKTLTKNIA